MRAGLAIFTLFLLTGFASTSYSGVCDERIDDALWERGVCAGDRCSIGVADGKLASLPGNGVAGFQKLAVTNQGALSSVEIPSSLYSADLKKPKVTSIQLNSGSGGSSTLTMFAQESNSQAKRRFEYNMKSDGKECSVDQIAESDARSDVSSVHYDKEFCDGAANAFKGMDSAAAKVCQDAIGGLQKLYETRSSALKDQKKQFAAEGPSGRGDSARNWAAAKIAPQSKGLLERVMEQRDNCAPPMQKMRLVNLLKEFRSGESFRHLNMEQIYEYPWADFGKKRSHDKRRESGTVK